MVFPKPAKAKSPKFVQMAVVILVIIGGVTFVVGHFAEKTLKDSRWHIPDNLVTNPGPFDPRFVPMAPLELAKIPRAPRFDVPMGTANGALTYNAQTFLTNRHLGDDLNGIGGYNSDLGDPVYAIAIGKTVFAGWAGEGWGNIVIVQHILRDGSPMQSVYAHLDEIHSAVGVIVHRGEQIGTVGNANGRYWAHLHFELKQTTMVNIGAGYAKSRLNRINPSEFIEKNRNAPERLLNPSPGLLEEPELPEINTGE